MHQCHLVKKKSIVYCVILSDQRESKNLRRIDCGRIFYSLFSIIYYLKIDNPKKE